MFYWLNSAAEDGAADAMRALARHYGLGIGTPINPIQMYKWLALAHPKGDSQARMIVQFMIQTKAISSSLEFK